MSRFLPKIVCFLRFLSLSFFFFSVSSLLDSLPDGRNALETRNKDQHLGECMGGGPAAHGFEPKKGNLEGKDSDLSAYGAVSVSKNSNPCAAESVSLRLRSETLGP
jgi:hypothetical protein